MPRPSTLTDTLQREVCTLLRGGSTLRDAFATSGVPWSTAKVWMQRGRAPKTPADDTYVVLVEEMERAQASYRVGLALSVTVAAKKHWQAAIAAQRRMDERELLRAKLQRDRASENAAADDEDDRVILLYPVPCAEGAMPMLPDPERKKTP